MPDRDLRILIAGGAAVSITAYFRTVNYATWVQLRRLPASYHGPIQAERGAMTGRPPGIGAKLTA